MMNPEQQRCTKEQPMPESAGGFWHHENTVDAGTCAEGCCDYRQCLNCGLTFRIEHGQ